jgi:hypothetical protein
MNKGLELGQEGVFAVLIDLIVCLLDKFLKQLIEFDVVISDHGTILSIQKVSLFGIFAG